VNLEDILALVSPAFVIGGFGVAIVRWLVRRYEREQAATRERFEAFNTHLNAGVIKRLDSQDLVQAQTLALAQATNGRVTVVEATEKTLGERMARVEGQTEALLATAKKGA
jgi:hypothetical protein